MTKINKSLIEKLAAATFGGHDLTKEEVELLRRYEFTDEEMLNEYALTGYSGKEIVNYLVDYLYQRQKR